MESEVKMKERKIVIDKSEVLDKVDTTGCFREEK